MPGGDVALRPSTSIFTLPNHGQVTFELVCLNSCDLRAKLAYLLQNKHIRIVAVEEKTIFLQFSVHHAAHVAQW